MGKIEIWYTIEKSQGGYTVWLNKEGTNSYGSLGIYSALYKKDCIDYCKEHNIKVSKRK